MPEEEKEQPQVEINPTLEKPKRNWKQIGLIIILLSLAVILVGAGIYFSFTKKGKEVLLTTQKQTTPLEEIQKKTPKKYSLVFDYVEETSENNYENGIYLLDSEDTVPQKILDNPDYKTPNNSQFTQLQPSPDGEYLGWIKAGRKKGNLFEYGKLDLFRREITNVKAFSNSDTEYLSFFEWSETGNQVALYFRSGNGPYSWNLKVIDISTMEVVREFQMGPKNDDLTHPVEFSWSNDNFIVIFVRVLPLIDKFTSGGEDYIVYSYSVNGEKELEKKIHHSDRRPIFDISADGKNVTFVKVFGNNGRYRGELWYGNIDGTQLIKIADTPTLDCTNGRPVNISPNKKWVAVGSGCADNTAGIIVNLESKEIVGTNVSFGEGLWSPDSQQIWAFEVLYSQPEDTSIPSGPSSQSNYILNTKGEVVKKFDPFAGYAVWVPAT